MPPLDDGEAGKLLARPCCVSPQEVNSLLLGQHFTAACPATQKPFSFSSACVPCWIQTQPLATQPLNRPLSPRLTSLPSLKKKKKTLTLGARVPWAVLQRKAHEVGVPGGLGLGQQLGGRVRFRCHKKRHSKTSKTP